MTPKRPKKRAAAAPQPEKQPAEPKLPRAWNVILYSEQEVQIVGLALSILQTQTAVPEDPIVLLEQLSLQAHALHAAVDLVNGQGGFPWLNAIRKRFADIARAIEEEGR
jgi:hypothetical protein